MLATLTGPVSFRSTRFQMILLGVLVTMACALPSNAGWLQTYLLYRSALSITSVPGMQIPSNFQCTTSTSTSCVLACVPVCSQPLRTCPSACMLAKLNVATVVSQAPGFFKGKTRGRILGETANEVGAGISDTRLQVFSALVDPIDQEVTVVSATFSEDTCPTFIPSLLCRFDVNGRRLNASVERLHWANTTEFMLSFMCVFKCKLPSGVNASQGFDFSLQDPQSSSPGKTIPVQQITVTEEDHMGVSMCLGPLYNNVPQFVDWLHLWDQLGVQRVYAYPALYTPEEWHALHLGLPFARPHLFAHHLVQWEVYKPIVGASYHSQVYLYNDCLYRNRRRDAFLVYMDSDEVIEFPRTHNPVRNLLSWLRATVPPRSAGVCFKMAYTKNVPCSRVTLKAINANYTDMKGEGGLDLAEYEGYQYLAHGATPDMRVQAQQAEERLKCIVRPTAVKSMYVHQVYRDGYVEGWNETVVLRDDQAVHKHIRCAIHRDWGLGDAYMVSLERKHKRVKL